MASATGSVLGTIWYGGNTSYATNQVAYAGYDGGTHRVTAIKLTTPAFSGDPTALVLNMYPYKGVGTDVTLRWAICTSDANYSKYCGTSSAVTDANQIASGTVDISSISSSVSSSSKKTLTLSSTKLKASTTYYVMLWSAGTTGMGISAVNTYLSTETLTMTASVTYTNTYKLTISQGTGSTITVKRGSTTLSNGATVTYGDVLTISFSASTGYNLGTHTVNGFTFTSGKTHTVTGAVSVVSTATKKTYTLSISAGTGSSITVKKGSTTLSNGATITHGDSLTITFAASTGYNLGTHTVNGSTFTSGGMHTVAGAVSVVSTASKKTFTLSISAGTGSTITVKKGSTTFSDGATITYGDELTISFGASTGYNLGTHTVNGSTFTSGGTHTVTGAVTVKATATKKTYTLSMSAGTGSSITVKRNGTALANGATITYGDELTITFNASTGYNLGTHTVNGSTFTSGGTHTVTGAVAVVATATIKTYKITISQGTGTTITVKNGSTAISNGAYVEHGTILTVSFGYGTGYEKVTQSHNSGNYTITANTTFAATAALKTYALSISAGAGSVVTVKRNGTALSDGATITYGDVLTITFVAVLGYELITHTVNGSPFDSGGTHTVTGAVAAAATARQQGLTHIDIVTMFKAHQVNIDMGDSHKMYVPWLDTGSGWVRLV